MDLLCFRLLKQSGAVFGECKISLVTKLLLLQVPIQLIPIDLPVLRFLELVNYSLFEERLIVFANYTNKQFKERERARGKDYGPSGRICHRLL